MKRKDKMLTLDTWEDEASRERQEAKTKKDLIWIAKVALLVSCSMFFCLKSNANEITNIVYAEQSNPIATNALLNTYYSSKRKGETLEQSFKRQSCAYRFKSKQYKKARTGKLNEYERKIYKQIAKQVNNFTPSKNWKYVKHENIHFYNSFDEMIIKLKKKWGDNINYKNCKLIGDEYYFERKI